MFWGHSTRDTHSWAHPTKTTEEHALTYIQFSLYAVDVIFCNARIKKTLGKTWCSCKQRNAGRQTLILLNWDVVYTMCQKGVMFNMITPLWFTKGFSSVFPQNYHLLCKKIKTIWHNNVTLNASILSWIDLFLLMFT